MCLGALAYYWYFVAHSRDLINAPMSNENFLSALKPVIGTQLFSISAQLAPEGSREQSQPRPVSNMHQALSPILQGCCSKRITHQCDTTISQGWKMVAKSRLRSAGAFRAIVSSGEEITSQGTAELAGIVALTPTATKTTFGEGVLWVDIHPVSQPAQNAHHSKTTGRIRYPDFKTSGHCQTEGCGVAASDTDDVSAQDALIYGDNELTPSTIATNLFLGLTLSSLARLNLYPVNFTTLLTSRSRVPVLKPRDSPVLAIHRLFYLGIVPSKQPSASQLRFEQKLVLQPEMVNICTSGWKASTKSHPVLIQGNCIANFKPAFHSSELRYTRYSNASEPSNTSLDPCPDRSFQATLHQKSIKTDPYAKRPSYPPEKHALTIGNANNPVVLNPIHRPGIGNQDIDVEGLPGQSTKPFSMLQQADTDPYSDIQHYIKPRESNDFSV
ncbi:uncharacterized protein BO96DRAFT_399335 [Aspergillus niger CBS 101883]|uniref:uncharacterized protein n=1 Tax=Aspergillus lacticoffeatus (strain CBS 101883) TaxID=1450533 RepID=UPI000D7FF20F|nr:uncharacterized protein BO96DRAFT_399335 [Aspergillus niger CBS 101883]PYH53883.1 hypothetical protein BO96DRAFT_399335 [Aspergillus niger CBS 101883]